MTLSINLVAALTSHLYVSNKIVSFVIVVVIVIRMLADLAIRQAGTVRCPSQC